jgi:Xaa-Pro aminopeptidase
MTTLLTIPQRLAALRQAMQQQHIDACLIPSSDPHLSEYLPATGRPGSGCPVFTARWAR